jgi:hypothetical protein
MFCVPILVFGGSEGVGSRFYVLRSRSLFRRFRGRRVPFSCFASPYSFSAVAQASGPVFMFRRYRGRRVPFSYFALPDMFSTVLWAWCPVFRLCAPGLVFDGFDGVGCRFHVFDGTRGVGCRMSFSCFALPDTFSAVQRASGPIFMFCTPGLIFNFSEGVRSSFRTLHSRTRFRQY